MVGICWNPIHQNGDDLGMVYDAGFTWVYHIVPWQQRKITLSPPDVPKIEVS